MTKEQLELLVFVADSLTKFQFNGKHIFPLVVRQEIECMIAAVQVDHAIPNKADHLGPGAIYKEQIAILEDKNAKAMVEIESLTGKLDKLESTIDQCMNMLVEAGINNYDTLQAALGFFIDDTNREQERIDYLQAANRVLIDTRSALRVPDGADIAEWAKNLDERIKELEQRIERMVAIGRGYEPEETKRVPRGHAVD